MFDTVVIATDGSASAERAVTVALDLADKFDATVLSLSVVDEGELDGTPEDLRADLEDALEETAADAVQDVADFAADSVTTAVRRGHPPTEIRTFAESVDADVVAMGTRGRHGEHGFVLGSVAEAVVRRCPMPVLTVRQLESA
ncbi:universal stress protein [Haloarculaceae archaeon H-GB2-1]|nr:universal stress protein [Haloarculaceae archaeon H-GB1-1]MEA5385798.1 universal stress protein [Haloarculaceae archaeon H-GB11]MEA5407298.1 universal stress protein [Haloarculaceae archaeon H-GB2-1]